MMTIAKRYLKLYRGSYVRIGLGATVLAAQSFLLIVISLLIRNSFDKLIPSGDFSGLCLAAAAIVLVLLTGSGLTLVIRRLTLHITKRATQRLRETLLDRCYKFSRSYYTQADMSHWQNFLVTDAERVDGMSRALMVQLLPASITAIILAGVLIVINPLLFAVIAAASPVAWWTAQVMRKKVMRRAKAFREAFKSLNRSVLFVFQMMDLTRILAAETEEKSRQTKKMDHVRRSGLSLEWTGLAYSEVQAAIVFVMGALILVIGGKFVTDGKMTLGSLLSFYVVVGMLTNQIRVLGSAFPSIVTGIDSLKILFDFMDTPDAEPYHGKGRVDFDGRVDFENVSFGYRTRPVLQRVTLSLSPGRISAVVGPNGSGKTTLVHLLLGFYRPQSGRLLAGDQPYDDLDMRWLRSKLGVVTQSPLFFKGSILDNITYGLPRPDMERVEKACRIATAGEFIRMLPGGFDTDIGSQGILLSGGQRQKIAIARALMKEPRLLIMDEPTNHLDSESVDLLIRNLKSLDPAPAILLISHDPSVLRYSHMTYGLSDGLLSEAQPRV